MRSIKADKLESIATTSLQTDHMQNGLIQVPSRDIKILPSRHLAPGRGPYASGRVANGQLSERKIYREARFHSGTSNDSASAQGARSDTTDSSSAKLNSLDVPAQNQGQGGIQKENRLTYAALFCGGERYYLPVKSMGTAEKEKDGLHETNDLPAGEEWSADEKLAADIRKALTGGETMSRK